MNELLNVVEGFVFIGSSPFPRASNIVPE